VKWLVGLVDAGGGTVDVCMFEVNDEIPFRLKEEVIPPRGV